jgi:hypothetical protein
MIFILDGFRDKKTFNPTQSLIRYELSLKIFYPQFNLMWFNLNQFLNTSIIIAYKILIIQSHEYDKVKNK